MKITFTLPQKKLEANKLIIADLTPKLNESKGKLNELTSKQSEIQKDIEKLKTLKLKKLLIVFKI